MIETIESKVADETVRLAQEHPDWDVEQCLTEAKREFGYENN